MREIEILKYVKCLVMVILFAPGAILTQQDNNMHHNHTDSMTVMDSLMTIDTMMVVDSTVKENTDKIDSEMNMHLGNNDEMGMSHSYSLSFPMNRNGSGTGWLPDESPMTGYMKHSGGWMLMLHGSIFLRYTASDITNEGSYGSAKWDAPNWFMGMAQKKIGKDGLFKAGLMMSLDRLTEGGSGYPLLFQSGETWEGKRLVNRQHPHDLFSELSVAYTQRINKNIDITAYLGYPGEPAIGPVAFMHRVSSSNNPDAPLSHHWQDATHITFGVGTLGVRYGMFRLEGSVFSGKEPDENRLNFDKPDINSYSYRLSFNPTGNFAIQVSQGFLKSPEALESGINVRRTTASITHSHNFTPARNINSTIAWGLNDKGLNQKEHSLLAEGNFQLKRINFYGRYEFVQKDPEELGLDGFDHDAKFNINALTLGANYRVFQFSETDLSAGIQGSIYFAPSALQQIYGKNPLSAQIYFKLSPQ